jgi:L-ascorbate metabolism protein UlaG (beta-lactamase superfamily)
MKTLGRLSFVIVIGVALSAGAAPPGQTVKITPLGSHDNQYCFLDRALLFEDPSGVRILYDAGRTTSESDPRLGTVHAVLLSHMHNDHLGEVKYKGPNQGTCQTPETLPATPHSTTALIAAHKSAMLVAGGEMSSFLAVKAGAVFNPNGPPVPPCETLEPDNRTVVPKPTCHATLRPGAHRFVSLSADGPGVEMATVTAIHTNGIGPAFLGTALPAGTFGYVGDATGFVLRFSNGLVVYLTGDTGITTDMETVVRRYYGAELVVINLSNIFATGPREAAFVVNELVKPRSVIPSHASEVAFVNEVLPGRLKRFIDEMQGSDVQILIPRSGVMMEVDGAGRCVAGCG